MVKIGTHNGTFHCDEALACAMLKMLPTYANAEIVRTRDPSKLDACDIVVDVGGVYDHASKRYDHHQRDFALTHQCIDPRKPWTTKLSSAGLVYVHYGREVIAQTLKNEATEKDIETIFDKVYKFFIEEIDAIDNGVMQSDGPQRYHITTNLSSRVGNLNPSWRESGADENDRFEAAMKLVASEFSDRVHHYYTDWIPARVLVENAVNERIQVDPSGEIACLGAGGCPWKDHLLSLEAEYGIGSSNDENSKPSIKYMLYRDQNSSWRVQCVPEAVNSMVSRLPLPEPWRGIREEKLSELCGIPGCIFVHASGFIGGHRTYEGALAMAQKSLAFSRADSS